LRAVLHRFTILALPLLALFGLGSFAQAQTFDFKTDRVPIISLDGLWHFHTGDDPRWADPEFDDSAWPLLRSDTPWSDQGYQGYTGVAWYHFRVAVPVGSSEPLMLQLGGLSDSFELYANGQRIGSCGSMPPHPREQTCPDHFYSLPADPPGGVLSIAIRVWSSPIFEGDGPEGRSLIGTAAEMKVFEQSDHDASQRYGTQEEVMFMLEGLSALFAFALFLFSRANREYFWFAAMMMFYSLERLENVFNLYHSASLFSYFATTQPLFVGAKLAMLAFIYVMLRGRRSIWLYLGILGVILSLPNHVIFSTRFGEAHGVGLRVLFLVLGLPSTLWIIALVTRRALQGSFDARLLLLPVLMKEALDLLYFFVVNSYYFGWQHVLSDIDVILFSDPFEVHLNALVDLLFMFAMSIILINRFIRTRREEDRFTAELEAARTVQQLLLPSAVPQTPGFSIESIYLPAQEVSGDFFHVVRGNDGSILIVVGDVSGKGLSAAMTVSAIIGALRICPDRAPGHVLAQLNHVLHGYMSGFATCCAALIDVHGSLVIANAGHLSPYWNGKELELEGGLPLGLVEDAEYGESHFTLTSGDRLTFISDGVVEAINPQGELFGFERTQAISQQPVETMAKTAKDFGQEDDITVLAVSYQPVPAG
jgi:sigma-B regulation protein RsbU (phosphoserine phosphatase)